MVLLAIGLFLIIEGLVYVLAPSLVERLLLILREMTEEQRRLVGLLAVTTGAVFVWLARLWGV